MRGAFKNVVFDPTTSVPAAITEACAIGTARHYSATAMSGGTNAHNQRAHPLTIRPSFSEPLERHSGEF